MRKLALIGSLIIAADRLTKIIIRGTMFYGDSVKIFDFLRITYVENTGTAWGLFAGRYSNHMFLILNVSALLFLLVNYSRFVYDVRSSLAWIFIISGALGNLGDRIFIGAVVDFIDLRIFGYNFPVFNIADSALTVGGTLLFLALAGNFSSLRFGSGRFDAGASPADAQKNDS